MFDFEEIEEKTIKELEKRIDELDNQVKYWKSMYEKNKNKVIVKTIYPNENQEHMRTKAILKLHKNTRNKLYKESLIQELYGNYGIDNEIIEKTDNDIIDVFGVWK